MLTMSVTEHAGADTLPGVAIRRRLDAAMPKLA